jgi:hypothetical protein
VFFRTFLHEAPHSKSLRSASSFHHHVAFIAMPIIRSSSYCCGAATSWLLTYPHRGFSHCERSWCFSQSLTPADVRLFRFRFIHPDTKTTHCQVCTQFIEDVAKA